VKKSLNQKKKKSKSLRNAKILGKKGGTKNCPEEPSSHAAEKKAMNAEAEKMNGRWGE